MYSIPDNDAKDYFVDHSASVAVINPNGKIVAMFKPKIELNQVPTIEPKILVEDFTTLVD
jgi:protein SCO1/2